MLISNSSISAINQSMSTVIENGYNIAKRVDRFSQVAAETASNDQTADHNSNLSAAIGDMAKQVSQYQALGRLASGQLAIYSLVASDGKS